MSEVKIPSWMLPIGAAIIPAAIAWGSMQAMAQATDEEVKRVSAVVEKVAEETSDNTKKSALNEQAIQQIADGLSRQVEISQATDEKLGTLIELMLKERR
ncbi:MAG: hypothetical protein CMC89_05095 [Flavobacteriaceae bacterium]|nr:hypothetical protein [Flavobacteriaceae bacterium]|tara:strand:- start:1271 stop:1570 length:300 start_codon:yes stop_codon:yes gene_type:complete